MGVNLFNEYGILSMASKPGGASGDLDGVVERGREIRAPAAVRLIPRTLPALSASR